MWISPVSPFSVPRFYLESHIAFHCHASLASANLWQFLILSLSFVMLTLLKRTGQLFVHCLSIWAGLMCSHGQMVVTRMLRSDVVSLFSELYQEVCDVSMSYYW